MFNAFGKLILENDISLLRPLELNDLELLKEAAFSDPDLLKFSPSKINNEDLLRRYLTDAIAASDKGIRFPMIIYDKLQKKYAGSTSFGNPSEKDMRVEIGWTWLGSQFQRKGLNRSNKFLMLQFGFEVKRLKRIEFKTDTRNVRSRNAMIKIGAVEEGILRSHTVLSDGYRRDTIYYSILANEWPKVKKTIFSDFI